MARPDKQGMDYFPLDVSLQTDDKLAMIIGEFQFKGEFIYIKLLAWIYKHEGYFSNWDEMEQLKFANSVAHMGGATANLTCEVVVKCIKWGLFDKAVFDAFQILTSDRIQKTWLDATRKRKGRKYHPEYWLLDSSDGLEAEETTKKTEETLQSKVKERKEDKSKEKKTPIGVVASDEARQARMNLVATYKSIVEGLTGKSVTEIWLAIKSFVLEKRPDFIEPYVELWRLFAAKHSLASVETISDSRKRKFSARIKEQSFDFIKILEEISKSAMLKGDDSKWKVSFDWIFENDKNYLKIIEGNYK